MTLLRTLLLVLALLLAALWAASCNTVSVGMGNGAGAIAFKEIFEERQADGMKVADTVELDTDGDTEAEWVVLYRYDPYLKEQEWANTPIQGIVYDALPCTPPIIQEWPLPSPDNDYLGEG